MKTVLVMLVLLAICLTLASATFTCPQGTHSGVCTQNFCAACCTLHRASNPRCNGSTCLCD
ncbi:unnamed protein product [Callosobruchus maculatus]|uniref:Invertebrate defensins family profile domain-containing protein n=1 Tax=Callosobruchus maculatus TaxID=64391 RepID=A0A653D3Q6_CALMS|nr:unnamed protein product [Callosobruchus maculatus]